MKRNERLLLPLVVVFCISFCIVNGKVYPEQIHLSITSDPSQMVVQWITWNSTQSTVVKYGTTRSTYDHNSTGSTSTYSTTGWGGIVHTVILDSLSSSTAYYYVCGDSLANVWSDEFSFRTQPSANDRLDVAVYGDMGLDNESDEPIAKLNKEIQSLTYDFVLHMGDIAYTDNDGAVNQSRYDAFMNKIQPIAANAPYMVCPGNQEQPFDFQEYLNRWRMPGKESGSETNLWYSYDVGPVHFIAMSTEHHFNPGSPQYTWLRSDLQKANSNRAQRPWIIVFGHRPMYCSNAMYDTSWFVDCYVFAPGFRSLLEPLFHQYSVDIYLCGHMHDGEYTYPIYNGQITSNDWHNPPSTIHIISGYAGSREGFNGFSNDSTESFSAWRQDTHYGYAHMTVYNASHLLFSYKYADDDSFREDLWITRDSVPTVKNVNDLADLNNQNFGDGMEDFIKGIGIGLAVDFGNIPDCISDYTPLNYTFTLAFKLLEEGFDTYNITEIAVGFQVLNQGLHDLYDLIKDCGGIPGLEDFLEILEEFEKYGAGAVSETEILKILENFPALENDMKMMISFWNAGEYTQAGVYAGYIIGIMVKPPQNSSGLLSI